MRGADFRPVNRAAHLAIADRWNAVRFAALSVGPRGLSPTACTVGLKILPHRRPAVPWLDICISMAGLGLGLARGPQSSAGPMSFLHSSRQTRPPPIPLDGGHFLWESTRAPARGARCTFTQTRLAVLHYDAPVLCEAGVMSKYGSFEIETLEIGRALWHARLRRADHQPISIDGVVFKQVDLGFAWPTSEAATAEARDYIDRMAVRLELA